MTSPSDTSHTRRDYWKADYVPAEARGEGQEA